MPATRTSRRTSALEIPAGTPPDWNYKRAQQVLSHLPDALTTNGTVWEIFWNFPAESPRWGDWEQIPAIPGLTTK